jgi:hypothetical protein
MAVRRTPLALASHPLWHAAATCRHNKFQFSGFEICSSIGNLCWLLAQLNLSSFPTPNRLICYRLLLLILAAQQSLSLLDPLLS